MRKSFKIKTVVCMLLSSWTVTYAQYPQVTNEAKHYADSLGNISRAHRTADGGDYATMGNFINNYYKPGPITPKDKPIAYRIVAPESRSIRMLPRHE